MTTSITLADTEALPRLLGLLERRGTEAGDRPWDDETREREGQRIAPLLTGGSEGAVWLIGPSRAPLGYAAICFGWSMREGREAWLEDMYLRPSVRRRGIGREVVHAISVSLRGAGVRRLHVRLPRSEHSAQEFCTACGFGLETRTILMSEPL